MTYSHELKNHLLEVAHKSIEYGLATGMPLAIAVKQEPSELSQSRATFVTLTSKGELRGCIGMLEAHRPLIQDVTENAFAAAFHDPRFPPVTRDEFNNLEISISILSPSEEIFFPDETTLLQQICPGVDGLILAEGHKRGTFLPSVWKDLPNKTQFLKHLKRKAGLAENYWSPALRVWRYTTESFSNTATTSM